MTAVASDERHSQIAFDRHLGERDVQRELPRDAARVMAQVPADDVLARRAGQIVLDVVGDHPLFPIGERADPIFAGELGDHRVIDPQRTGQMLHELAKELGAGALSGPLGNRLQRGGVARLRGRSRKIRTRELGARRRSRIRIVLERLTVAGQDGSPSSIEPIAGVTESQGAQRSIPAWPDARTSANHCSPADGLSSANSCSIFFRMMESPLAFFQLNSPSQR